MSENREKMVALIGDTLKLQHSFNAVVNKDWIKAGYNWRRAMWIEAAELVDMLGYKWWKDLHRTDWDQKQCLLEVVDIYHFLLSECMIDRKSAADIYNSYVWATRHTYAKTKELKIKTIEEFVANCLDKQTIVTSFFQVVVALDIPLESLLKYYLGKNALNKFRQDNGYKAGTYQKIWCYNNTNAEDNKVLENILDANETASFDEIYNLLSAAYSTSVDTMKGE